MILRGRRLVLTCEHASNRVPERWAVPFARAERVLASHRGWDIGGLEVATALAARFAVPLAAGEVTRLLVDLNRSLHNRTLFSTYSRQLSADERAALVERYWRPHRARVFGLVDEALAGRPRLAVLHVALHSFTPRLAGHTRNADVGLLYDPSRPAEAEIARALATTLGAALPALRVRLNYPYRGSSDGLPRALRARYAEARLASVSVELNQKHAGKPAFRDLLQALGDALEPLVVSPRPLPSAGR
jgi:predicted N-formylglutamate amidohydrolase